MDLDRYRAAAEEFSEQLGREHFRYYAGLQPGLGLQEVYRRFGALFTREAVLALRELALAQAPASTELARSRRALLGFAVEGHLAQATSAIEAELAAREAAAHVELDGRGVGLRETVRLQAVEADPDRRARIEAARLAVVAEQLTPLRREAIQVAHQRTGDLGYRSYRELYEHVTGVDLGELGRQAAALTAATDARYADVVDEPLRRSTGLGLQELRRSDLPLFFRQAAADPVFPPQRLVASLRETLGDLGIDLDAQPNLTLDVDPRPRKSPRPFCAPIRVPTEICLVIAPVGGHDDYTALFHEGGHAQHYAWVDPGLPFEFRRLGDNAVTEAFAFLFDRLIEEPGWLRRHLGVAGGEQGLAGHARAQRLIFLRRHAAKLAYELELHARPLPDTPADAEPLSELYARELSHAVGVRWPRETWLTDLDPALYVVTYLRAWALESRLRALLRGRFGPAWFTQAEAGELLRSLWRDGQRRNADELLAALTGEVLDLRVLVDDLEAGEWTGGPASGRGGPGGAPA